MGHPVVDWHLMSIDEEIWFIKKGKSINRLWLVIVVLLVNVTFIIIIVLVVVSFVTFCYRKKVFIKFSISSQREKRGKDVQLASLTYSSCGCSCWGGSDCSNGSCWSGSC